jgi:hypothetical protein
VAAILPYSNVQTKEAGNKDDNYDYADDVENVHDVLRSRYARFQYESADARTGTSGPDDTFHHSLSRNQNLDLFNSIAV